MSFKCYLNVILKSKSTNKGNIIFSEKEKMDMIEVMKPKDVEKTINFTFLC